MCIISSGSNYRQIRGGGGFISVRIHIELMSIFKTHGVLNFNLEGMQKCNSKK